MVRPTLILAGPTASGKSAIALALAERHGGAIICGDSRQVYRGMQIASAGPSDDELARAPHMGYAQQDPGSTYDAARFVTDTDAFVSRARADNLWPIIVGGAGLYLRAYRYGLDEVPSKDPKVRARLEAEDLGVLYRRLQTIDPERAAAISANDPVRIVRALEIFEVTGVKPSERRAAHEGPPRDEVEGARWIYLEAEREWLKARIDARVPEMFARGLIDEARALRERYPAHDLLQTMGVREALAFVDGELDRASAVERMQARHRQYAKRQVTWFKKETHWTRVDPVRGGVEEQLFGH